MIKDRAQKSLALSLAVSKGWLPQLEVEIEPSNRLHKTKSLLTDVDVLAIAQNPMRGLDRCIFDCKSGARESAISRAFWVRGLMDRISANHGFVVLSDQAKILLDHRMSAMDMSITLLHDSEISDLASSWQGSTEITAHAANIDIWEIYLKCGSENKRLDSYRDFAQSSFWTIKDPGERCRKLVSKLRAIGSELDPNKAAHLALFGDAVCLLLVTLSELATKLMLLLLRPKEKGDFSTALLALLYGGQENLQIAQRLQQLTARFGGEEIFAVFPEFPRFEQLAREIVQAPLQALPAAILSREIAFESISEGKISEGFQIAIARSSSYAPKFTLLAGEFLRRATKAPPEFSQHIGDKALVGMAMRIEKDKAL